VPLRRFTSICLRIAVVGVAVATTACSHRERMSPVLDAFERGRYDRAAGAMTELLSDRRESEKDRTLYELEGGLVYAAAGEPSLSTQALAAADARMWEYLDEAPDVRVSEQAVAILSNQTIIAYRGTTYDRILCSTYLALNHLAQGDLGSAGVSLRRALEWQRDAVEKNAKEIEALEQQAKSASASKSYDVGRATSDPALRRGLDSAYGPLRELPGYGEFEIPFATQLRGLHFTLVGGRSELEQATVAFRRVAGMLPEGERAPILADAAAAEAAALGGLRAPSVHVFLESGLGPRLEELRIDIPLFLRTVPYVGAAFPVLRRSDTAIEGFSLRAGGEAYAAALLTDMDRVVGDEFNRRLPAIITMTLVSSATKAIATYAIQDSLAKNNRDAAVLVAVLGGVYQFAVNRADLRIWSTLPKHVHYARCPAPVDGSVAIELADGQRLAPIAVESDGVTIVHIRASQAGAPPVVRTMRFPLSR
jgi:hypothetical protein